LKAVKKVLVFIFLSITSWGFGQSYLADRYQNQVFPDVISLTDVKYGEAPQWVWPYWDVDLNLDVYMPDGDDNPRRPLIIFAHAGGFINGSKDVDNMVAICDSFAQKGFVTASLDYRKGFDPLDGESAERAVYRGIQDGKAAVRYFKENASLYDIDTNYIFFGGMSAGGFMALHVAYMDKEEERPESTYGGGLVNDLECLDCAGNDYEHSSEVMAILDFWGAVNDTTIIESDNIPALIMHGENDETVPYEFGHPFGLFTLPETYGGLPISERMDHVGVMYEMHTSEGSLHMLDGSDNGSFEDGAPNSFWSDTLLPETTDFIYELIKPQTERLSPAFQEVCFGETRSFMVSDSAASHYIWSYDEDAVEIVSDDNSGTLTLLFSSPGTYSIEVVEFNQILCPGDTILFEVEVADEIMANFSEVITDFNQVEFINESTGGTSYFWDFGDGSTSDLFSPTHEYAENGTYDVTLQVSNELECDQTIEHSVIIEGLGIDSEGLIIDVYPNPFNDLLTIESNWSINQLLLIDASGKVLIHQSDLTGANSILQLNTASLASGVYWLKIYSESGQVFNIKLMH
jgi:acetyl esterase/lipase